LNFYPEVDRLKPSTSKENLVKKILIALTVALLAATTLTAQAAPGRGVPSAPSASTTQVSSAPATGVSDTKVFAIQMGTGVSYSLDTKDSTATQTVAAIYGLGDAVQAGFVIVKADAAVPAASYNLVRLTVFPVTDLSVDLDFGADGNSKVSSGFAVGYNLFKNSVGTLSTSLAGEIGYRFSELAKGNLGLGLALKVGI